MEISNMDDVIDSRDVIERIEELEDERQELYDVLNDIVGEESPAEAEKNLAEWEEEYKGELEVLQKLAMEVGGSPDWTHGAQLINEAHFIEYCEELCKDVGEIPPELPWYIANHIDWESVAEEIKIDYTEVDFDGESYFIRA